MHRPSIARLLILSAFGLLLFAACAPCKRATPPTPDPATNTQVIAPEITPDDPAATPDIASADDVTPNADAPVGTLPVGAPCGPGLGDCDATGFCRFPADAPCGDGGAAGTCEARPIGCHRDCPGVCGCNGARFCNSCVAEARGYSIRHKGSCQKENDVTP